MMFNKPNYNLISNYADSRVMMDKGCDIESKYDNSVRQSISFDKDSYRSNNNRLNSTINDIIYNNDNVIPDMNSQDYNSFDKSTNNYRNNKDLFIQQPYIHPYMDAHRPRPDSNLNQICEKQGIRDEEPKPIKKEKKKCKKQNNTCLYITVAVSILIIIILIFSFCFYTTSKKLEILGRTMLQNTNFQGGIMNNGFNNINNGLGSYIL